MATITFEGYFGNTEAWTDVAANTITFSSSLTDPTANVTVAAWQDGTHVTTGDAGADQCGTNHMNNNKFLTTTTIDIDGGGSETLNDTNLTADECTLRFHFNHTSSIDVTNARGYTYDGTTVTTEAVGVDVYGFEQGEAGTTWGVINDDTTSGALTTGGIGGDNSGERLDLANRSTVTDAYWYCAISVSPETVGGKTSFDIGLALTYS